MKLLKLIKKFLNKIIMALENKKLSTYSDLASANIDTTTKLVVLTGATKVNNNLPVTNFIEDSLTSTSVVKPLSAKQGKALQDTKAPIANPTFTGAVNGITKSMVGLGNVDNTSDVNKPISTLTQNALSNKLPISNPIASGSLSVQASGDYNLMSVTDVDDGQWGLLNIGTAILNNIDTFADNMAAATLPTGTVYKTESGVLMIKY